MKVLSKYIICFSLLFSQFYIIPSGLPQFAHVFLMFFVCLFFLSTQHRNSVFKRFLSDNRWILYFVFYVLIVNAFFALVNSDYRFYMASIYWVYNVLLFLTIGSFLKSNSNYISLVNRFSIFSILVLGGLCFFYIGRFDFYPRFNAFFNDPNQMSYWAICTFTIYLFTSNRRFFIDLLLFSVLVLIVMTSMSRSGLLGILLFSPVLLSADGDLKFRYVKFLFLVSAFMAVGVYLVSNFNVTNLSDNELLTNTFNRIEATDTDSQFEIRGYNLLFDYPSYLISGSGQGAEYRFGRTHEIHSSWAAIVFYYGIPGFSIFVLFVVNLMKSMSFLNRVYFMAPFFYGISTYGLRTPIFWILIAIIASLCIREERNDKKEKVALDSDYSSNI